MKKYIGLKLDDVKEKLGHNGYHPGEFKIIKKLTWNNSRNTVIDIKKGTIYVSMFPILPILIGIILLILIILIGFIIK
jgi:hypothetical protein